MIATGGISDIGCVIDCLAAGAEAVQLCSALDHKELQVIGFLRQQLSELRVSEILCSRHIMTSKESICRRNRPGRMRGPLS
jgi:dihydroorotate dehydrogenase